MRKLNLLLIICYIAFNLSAREDQGKTDSLAIQKSIVVNAQQTKKRSLNAKLNEVTKHVGVLQKALDASTVEKRHVSDGRPGRKY